MPDYISQVSYTYIAAGRYRTSIGGQSNFGIDGRIPGGRSGRRAASERRREFI